MEIAEYADRQASWPGLGAPDTARLHVVIAPDQAHFDSITRGRIPSWGSGVAFPDTRTIVVIAGRSGRQTLMHELAHLALRHQVRRVPLWLDEGYASRAAGEWTRLSVLRVNLALLLGRVPTLRQVNRDLRGGPARADAAYAFATAAVLGLERLGGDRGLEPLLTQLRTDPDLDRALRRAFALTLDQFERRWQRDLRRRYGWIAFFTSMSVFWAVVGGLVAIAWWRRRIRDRVRREALNHGWVVEVDTPS